MNKHGLVLGLLTALVAVATLLPSNFQDGAAQRARAATLRTDPDIELASCAPNDDRYFALFFRELPFEQWPDAYHETVSSLVEEYLEPIDEIACDSPELLSVTPSNELLDAASKLPPWNTIDELAELRRDDLGFVLLEFLRVYECALLDRQNFLRLYIIEDLEEQIAAEELEPEVLEEYTHGDALSKANEQNIIIEEELAVARPALERVLKILAGTTRLAPLDAELHCLQRSSLDLRNALSLAADVSSCLPRIWNSRDVLRDTQ